MEMTLILNVLNIPFLSFSSIVPKNKAGHEYQGGINSLSEISTR